MEERPCFVVRQRDGEAMPYLCRKFRISRKTGYRPLVKAVAPNDLWYPHPFTTARPRHRLRPNLLAKKINISTVLAGQRLGIKAVDEGIWLVTFIDYDLGYIDLEQRTLQPLDNPFGPRLSPMS